MKNLTRILSPSVVRLLNGAQIIVKPLNGHLSKRKTALNTIAAKVVEQWLNDGRNKLIIQNQLFRLALDGMAVGMFSGKGCSYRPVALESFVRIATKKKRIKKTKRGEKTNERSTDRRV